MNESYNSQIGVLGLEITSLYEMGLAHLNVLEQIKININEKESELEKLLKSEKEKDGCDP